MRVKRAPSSKTHTAWTVSLAPRSRVAVSLICYGFGSVSTATGRRSHVIGNSRVSEVLAWQKQKTSLSIL
jgi:hypothetical protein